MRRKGCGYVRGVSWGCHYSRLSGYLEIPEGKGRMGGKFLVRFGLVNSFPLVSIIRPGIVA